MLQLPAAAIVTSADTAPIESTEQTVFSEEDIIVAVARHVKGEYDINSSPSPLSTQPLYNLSDSVIAYKVYMTDGSYIVVNANKDNPVIIEFSDPKMVSADSLRTLSANKRQYYLAPGIIAEKSDTKKSEFMIENVNYNLDGDTELIKKIETTFASMLNTPNPKLAAQHEIGLSLLKQYESSSGIINYGYMNIMCLLPALNMGHMVNGVGYREYSSGSNYCQIKDNWDAYGCKYTIFDVFDMSLVDLFCINLLEVES